MFGKDEGGLETALRNIAGLLGSLDYRFDIGSVAQRKLMQKVVYLAQALELPLNYSFSWYIHGPYSPRLTKDYYELQSRVQAGENVAGYRLNEQYAPIAAKLTSLLSSRPNAIDESDWAELLASTVFLRRESGYNDHDAHEALRSKKPHVADYFNEAIHALSSAELP